jgi:predicted glycogen debranching enzyme
MAAAGGGSGQVPRIDLDRQICHSFDQASSREWLIGNGAGGYAAGTVSGAATRRYHGLLIAALPAPPGRTLLLAGLELQADYRGQSYPLSAHEYADGTVYPEGYRHLGAFALNAGLPVWTHVFGDVRLSRTVWMGRGVNTTYMSFRLEQASAPVRINIVPLCTSRDHHGQTQRHGVPLVTPVTAGIRVEAYPGAPPLRILCAGAEFHAREDWYLNFRHRVEAGRGLGSIEDLYYPGDFQLLLRPGESATLICTAEADTVESPVAALLADHERRMALLAPVRQEPGWVRQLTLAADQFIVRQPAVGGAAEGASVIAGYPWFGDWGRDTMIALPGLCLATGRSDVAAPILRTWAGHISEGLLPNCFPENGAAPLYNTADATLWYLHALNACIQASGDMQLLRELWSTVTDIIDWHLRGTRYGIGVDPADGLLRAGEPGLQLTWMDAKVGERVITPRIGKPVEINALWYHALSSAAALAARLDDTALAQRYGQLAAQVQASFRSRFWYALGGYLYDVIDTPDADHDDPTLRPNQIFAVSLTPGLLDAAQAHAVVEICQRELLTPMGLRSLARSDPRYIGIYRGGPAERDAAYHQGTVWSWLLGPFALAHFRVHGDRAAAQALLAGIGSHLAEACVGSVSEIFDGDAPHLPRGCPAQAWSVAEILRAWFALKETA